MVAGSFGGTVCMEASVHCVLVYFEIPHSFIIWQEWHEQDNPMKWIGGSEGWGHKAVDTEVLSLDRFVVCSSCMGVRDQTCLPSNAWGMEENHPDVGTVSAQAHTHLRWPGGYYALTYDRWLLSLWVGLSFYLNILSYYSGCFIVFYFRSFCFREDTMNMIKFILKSKSIAFLSCCHFPKTVTSFLSGRD